MTAPNDMLTDYRSHAQQPTAITDSTGNNSVSQQGSSVPDNAALVQTTVETGHNEENPGKEDLPNYENIKFKPKVAAKPKKQGQKTDESAPNYQNVH